MPDSIQSVENPFAILDDYDDRFQYMYLKYPGLAEELARIVRLTSPPDPATSPANDRNGPPSLRRAKYDQGWSKEKGLIEAVKALREARTNPGEIGDGVRQFCELIGYLMSTGLAKGKGDVAAVARQELRAEETNAINRLLHEEGED